MAQISINNGNTFVTVDDLTDEEIQAVLIGGHFDPGISPSTESGTERGWLESYCKDHEATFGESLIFG